MESQETAAVPAAEPSPQASSTDTSGGAQNTGGTDPGVEIGSPQAFTPNFKVKVMDQEREIDPLFRGIVKDAETEKKVKEIFERAYGHEYLKPKYEKTKEELGTVTSQLQQAQQLYQGVHGLSQMVQRGDFGSFIEAAQIPKQLVFKYVHDEIQKMQMDPEQRQQIEQQQGLQKEYYTQQNVIQQQQQVLQQMQNQYEQVQVQQRVMELNSTLSRPEVKSIADTYDQRLGKPGAFREQVILRGRQLWNNGQGQDVNAEQAVQDVANMVSALLGQQAEQAGSANQMMVDAQTGAPVAQPRRGATLPNISGRGTSPVRKSPNSIDALRKLAAEMD